MQKSMLYQKLLNKFYKLVITYKDQSDIQKVNIFLKIEICTETHS